MEIRSNAHIYCYGADGCRNNYTHILCVKRLRRNQSREKEKRSIFRVVGSAEPVIAINCRSIDIVTVLKSSFKCVLDVYLPGFFTQYEF